MHGELLKVGHARHGMVDVRICQQGTLVQVQGLELSKAPFPDLVTLAELARPVRRPEKVFVCLVSGINEHMNEHMLFCNTRRVPCKQG